MVKCLLCFILTKLTFYGIYVVDFVDKVTQCVLFLGKKYIIIPYPPYRVFMYLGNLFKKKSVTLKSNKIGAWYIGKVPASLFSPTRALFSGPPRRPRPAHPPLHPMCYSSGPRAARRSFISLQFTN